MLSLLGFRKTFERITKLKKLFSIFTDEMDRCMYTGDRHVERHHVFHHTHRERMLSEKYGFIAPLRKDLHQNGKDSVHMNPNGKIDLELKVMCQRYYEEHIGSREEFRKEFRKSYL